MIYLLSFAFAENPDSVENAASPIQTSLELMMETTLATPKSKTLQNQANFQSWSGQSAKGYTQALFDSPSVLANLNYFSIDHELLPSVNNTLVHDFIRIDQEESRIILGYVNGYLHVGALFLHRNAIVLDQSPFNSKRLDPIYGILRELTQSCQMIEELQSDSKQTPDAWKGTKCNGMEIWIRYLPSEEYSIQATMLKQ